MKLTVGGNNEQRERIPLKTGLTSAILVKIIDMGSQDGGKFGIKPKIKLTFELPEQTHDFGEEYGVRPLVISKDYTKSLSEKSNLYKHLKGMLGNKFKGAGEVDLNSLLGTKCILFVQEATSAKGNKYEYIESIMPEETKPFDAEPHNDLIVFDLEDFDQEVFNSLGNFTKNKIAESPEFKALSGEVVETVETEEVEEGEDF